MTQEQILLKRLRELKRRIRALFTLHGVGRLLVALPPAVLAVVVLDYLLNFPAALRGLFLCGLVALAAVVIARHLWRPLRTRVTIDDVALELEGQFPDLDDRLATTVNFLSLPERRGESSLLRKAVISETLESVKGMRFGVALRPGPLVGVFLLGLLVAVAIGGLGLVYADEAGIGLERLFNPMSGKAWPKRTHLVLRDADAVIPIGSDHTVQVQLGPGSDVPGRVIVYYREAGADAFEHQVMDRRETASADAAQRGEPFFMTTFPRVRKSFDYYVEGGDDRQPAEGYAKVDARPRPRVENIQLTITPPGYVTDAEPTVVPGQGNTLALQGSTVVMEVMTNKAIGADDDGVPKAQLVIERTGARYPMEFVLPGSAASGELSDQERLVEEKKVARAYLRAQFELEESTHFDFALFCVDGFESLPSENRPSLTSVEDKSPRVAFEQPTQAIMDVTPRSVVEVQVYAEDDWGLTKTALGWQRASTEQKGVQGLSLIDIGRGTATRPLQLWAGRRWDLREIEPALIEGEELVYRAVAVDNFAWRGSEPHMSQTQEYRLRVVSVEAKKDDLARRLPAMALRVQDLVERQERLQGETKNTRAEKPQNQALSTRGREQTVEQEATQRELGRQAETLRDEFKEFLDEWRIHRIPQDEAFELGKALREALDAVAEDPMPKSADELRNARDAQATPDKQSKGLDQAVFQMQRTLDRLRGTLGQLERFNEAEQLSQQLKHILREQEKVTERTKEHAAQTLGKSEEELTADERETRQALERRQSELAEETKEAVNKIEEASKRLEQSDPAVAEALREALDEARTRDPARKMERAAKQVAENQSANARQNQEAAEEDIKKVIEKLEDRRAAELKDRIRALKEFQDEVRKLKEREEGHLKENREAQEQDKASEKAQELSKEQQDTAKDTQNLSRRMEDAEAGEATDSTRQAAGKMQQASGQLSQSQNKPAEKNQEEAIEKLEQADEQLEDEIEQAENELAEEQLEKLKEQLARIRDEEIQVNKATVDLEDRKQAGKFERSDRARLVFNQDKQNELLQETGGILGQFEEANVRVYHFALSIVADRMAESYDRLMKTLTDSPTQSAQERAIYILGQLVTALEEEIAERKNQDGQNPQGGGGQQGQAQLVPSLAELKMLRLMQQDVNQATTDLDTKIKEAEKPTPDTEVESKRLGRDQEKLKKLMETFSDPNAAGPGGERI